MKLEVQATDREENKQIALGTSKLNYLDPRISVAWYENLPSPPLVSLSGTAVQKQYQIKLYLNAKPFARFCLSPRCKKWGIPIEKIYNKTQREKFAWAIDMADEDYEF